MASEQAQAATTTTAEPTGSDKSASQVDTSKLSLTELDTLFQTGKVEVQSESASGGKEGQTTTGEAEVEKPAKTEEVVEPKAKETETPGDEPVVEAVKPEETTEAEPEKPKDEVVEPEGDELPERFRHKDPIDRAVNAVFKAAQQTGTPISWAEAERRVKGEPEKPAEVKTEVTTEAVKGTVATLGQEVTDLKTQLKAVTARIGELGKDETLFGPEHAKAMEEQAGLIEKLGDKNLELLDAKLSLRDTEAADKAAADLEQQEQITSRKDAKARALKLYPDAADDKTVLGKAVAKRIEELRKSNDPLLYADSAPFAVTATVAAELGIAPKTISSPPAKPPTTTQPRTTASPASAAKTAVQPGKPAEDAKKTFEYLRTEAPLSELDALFGADKNPLLAPA